MTPAFGDPPPGHNGSPRQGQAQRAVTDRDAADRGVAQRGPVERGASNRGVPDRGAAQRGTPDRGSADRGAPQRGMGQRIPAQPDASQWYDDDAGPLVRLYALTRGRARADDRVFSLLALVTAQSAPYDDPTLGPEQARVLALCRNAPQSVAEIAASCDLPLGVTRVLLGDLLEIGHIRVRQPAPPADIFDERILQEVIDGLRAL